MKLLITLLTVVFCSCSNRSSESNAQNNNSTETNQHNSTLTENSGCFMQRLSEFKSAYPDKKGGYEPLHYANSNYSVSEFMQRLSEFKSGYPDKKGGYEPLYYAASNHSLCK